MAKTGPKPKPLAERFWPKVDRSGGPEACWLWTGTKIPSGYGYVWTGKRDMGAHRVAWMLAHGTEPPSHLRVCHRCDNPSCVNPAHLFLGTNSDNMRDCVAKGRHVRVSLKGTANPRAKLSDRDVVELRREHAQIKAAGTSLYGWFTAKANEYGVNRITIARAISCEAWRHVL